MLNYIKYMDNIQRKLRLFKRMGMFNLDETKLTIKQASTLEELDTAHHLIYKSFVDKGYIQKNDYGIRLRVHDVSPFITTFICKCGNEIAGTLSIYHNNDFLKMPCCKYFPECISDLSTEYTSVCEITNLAVGKEYHKSNVLTFLTQVCWAYILKKKCDIGYIMISPEHKFMFETCMGFCKESDPIYTETNDYIQLDVLIPSRINNYLYTLSPSLLYKYYVTDNRFINNELPQIIPSVKCKAYRELITKYKTKFSKEDIQLLQEMWNFREF